MSLTYDQKSEIRMAFNEAYVAPDRRRDLRVKQETEAEIREWKRGKQGMPFRVRIEDFSPGGAGIAHGTELPVGSEYLLTVPRPHMDDLIILLTVVRTVPQDDGSYLIGLELSSVLDRSAMGQVVDAISRASRLTTRRTKILLLLLGIFGIGLSLLIK